MKRILLFSMLLALCFGSYAQTENFNNTFPAGWIFDKDLKLSPYNNPNKGCALDTGLVTPPIINAGGGNGNHILSTAATAFSGTTSSITVNFDIFTFKGETRAFTCADALSSFACTPQLKVYLVRGDYNATTLPGNADIYGQSSFVSLTANTNNSIHLSISKSLVAGAQYRLFVVGKATGCGNNEAQRAYVIDNIVVSEEAQSQNFNAGTPVNWLLNKDLSIGEYNNPAAGCANDRGIVTPPMVNNATNHIISTTPTTFGQTSGNLNVRFDLFTFNGNSNFLCAAAQNDVKCPTRVKVYVVAGNNNSTGDVPRGTIYGQSEFTLLGVGANVISVPVTTTLDPNQQYRLYVVGQTQGCGIPNAQRYVIDNIAVLRAVTMENFSNVFPAGWLFDRELKISQYCNTRNGSTTDIGLVTPPLMGNTTLNHLASSPATNYSPSTGTINVSFDLFTFAGKTRGFTCGDAQTAFPCKPDVKIYIVSGNYNATSVPPAAAILGQSDWIQLKNLERNVINIPVTGTFDGNQQYRLLIFGRSLNCNVNENTAQALVIDNIRIAEIERAILPVTFKSFNAVRNSSKVALSWETSTEINNRGFHVQRNVDGAWKNIGFVFTRAENGNSTADLAYEFHDVNNTKGVSQYRLLQVDMDNKGKYSEIRSVKGEGIASRTLVYPNPSVTGNVNVMFEDGNSLRDVIVSDVAGRIVKQYKSVNSNSLVIEKLVDGYYTIQITNHTTAATSVEKVIVKKR